MYISAPEETLITTALGRAAIYLVIFITSFVLTWRKARYSRLHARLQIVIGILFIGTTANFILDVCTAHVYYLSPVYYEDTPHALHEQNIYNLLSCIRDGIFGLNMFIADALLVRNLLGLFRGHYRADHDPETKVWRYYVFWNGRFVVILFPIFLLTLEASLGITVIIFQARIYVLRRNTPWSDPLPSSWYDASAKVAVLNKAYYVSTFAINILLSIAIATGPEARRMSKYSRVAHTVLESGTIYSVIILLAIMPGSGLLRDMAGVALMICVGFVPSMVIILVTLCKTTEYTTHTTDNAILETSIRFGTSPNMPQNTIKDDSAPAINIRLEDLRFPDRDGSKSEVVTGFLTKDSSSRVPAMHAGEGWGGW
ncbi:hypothetical protein GLOTRDRAFT_90606 [Gloeophyllum trabeum ATCC 11539]|uniref:STE3-domain-containing protein n=1 Tax=Gloeophyllum trabeum (strain ATCC 11539 / FP-39264 / Madison 617) TaxID=670483 RepID=S7RVJ7_GLOTA|nr:uncharacterized protein GLOTRDRAFT_90606 [Gloeophyllum trabeum ATCC 11539]EPQ58825.1 hypothetical protein GLOTRDRAFT_90606 [Gloeophyllum trabeum ATCC 11539]